MFVNISDDRVVNLAQVIEVGYRKDGSMWLRNTNFDICDIEEPYRQQFQVALKRVNEAAVYSKIAR
jgi:hypothetical protein